MKRQSATIAKCSVELDDKRLIIKRGFEIITMHVDAAKELRDFLVEHLPQEDASDNALVENEEDEDELVGADASFLYHINPEG